jgi:metal-responsive CopG/Arc/MetJ family transcriptional regulator
MTRTTITLPGDLVNELMAEVGAKSKTEAIITAIRDEIRARKREKIKAMAGKMEFTATASELRHRDRRLG